MVTVEDLDCSANFLTSSATTAKPFPTSPARAASMLALRAKRLVCSLILSKNFIIFSMPLLSSFNSPTLAFISLVILIDEAIVVFNKVIVSDAS